MISRQKAISKVQRELPDNVTMIADELDYLDCQKKSVKILRHMRLIK
jgi:hypothetical protein